MPQYEIVCPKCGSEETVFCHHSDKDSFLCDICSEKMLVKPSICATKIEGFKSKKGVDSKNYE